MSTNKDNKDNRIANIRITTIGDESSEKTSVLNVFKGEPYKEDDLIVSDYHEKHTYKGREFSIHVYDTSCSEEFNQLRPMSYANADVLIIFFALNHPESLKNVTNKWIVEVREYCPNNSVILVGTKSELWKPEEEGAITQAQIDEVSKQINAYKTVICSARNNENINEIFDFAVEAFIAQHSKDKDCAIQ